MADPRVAIRSSFDAYLARLPVLATAGGNAMIAQTVQDAADQALTLVESRPLAAVAPRIGQGARVGRR